MNTSNFANKTKLSQAERMARVEDETRSVEDIYVTLGGLITYTKEEVFSKEVLAKAAKQVEKKVPKKKAVKKVTK